jgi:3'5'-cyclic nucleotide phosphodiesterase
MNTYLCVYDFSFVVLTFPSFTMLNPTCLRQASHVTMSVTKLLSRIVAPSDVLDDYHDRANKRDLVSTLHDHTYGITSDPLTQFACVFSALIHDVDHAGVSNTQLVTESIELAERYNGKSVAEQNSIDLAWKLLMKDDYKELRHAIYHTKSEFVRFRQLLVNTVLATDIMDKELKNIRNVRWAKAFEDNEKSGVADKDPNTASVEMSGDKQEPALDQVNRKATIVIEHMIQASDVSHTMQHWHIYRKWNERFFLECYEAYVKGRAAVDPSIAWYEGELGFFDHYIIPLAKKLKECGVFGVSSYEYLQYAMNNRAEWESRGKEIVSEMKERVARGITNTND